MNNDQNDETKTPDDGQAERAGAAPVPMKKAWGDGAWGDPELYELAEAPAEEPLK